MASRTTPPDPEPTTVDELEAELELEPWLAAYVEVGGPIALPKRADFAPAREALAWHRENVLQR